MFTYDKALVMEMLHQNIALEKKALAALPAENAKRVEEWRKLVVKFVREELKRGGKLDDPRRFFRGTVRVRGGYACLDGLSPPKAPSLRDTGGVQTKINRLEARVLALSAQPVDKKFRMSEERFAKYVRGEFV